MENLENKTKGNFTTLCKNQWFRPTYYFPIQGYGDCRICTPDEKNKECRGYYPIRLYRIEVKEEQNGRIK